MQKEFCKTCAHYCQHYGLKRKRIYRLNCGHCTRYPTKRKRPDTAACEHYVSAPPDEDAFVSKEYLSKELLQYLLKLELLPKIEE